MYNEKLLQLFQCHEYGKIIVVCSNKKTQLKWYECFMLGYSYLRTKENKKAIHIVKDGLSKITDNFQKCLLTLVLIEAKSRHIEKDFDTLDEMRISIKEKDKREFILAYTGVVEASGASRDLNSKLSKVSYALVHMPRILENHDSMIQQITNNLILDAVRHLMIYHDQSFNFYKKGLVARCLDYYCEIVQQLYISKRFDVLNTIQNEFRKSVIRWEYESLVERLEKLFKKANIMRNQQ